MLRSVPRLKKSKSSGKCPPLSLSLSHLSRVQTSVCELCVRRASRSTDGTELGGRSRLCGLPCSFSQSKCSGKWWRCIKTWPGQRQGMDGVYHVHDSWKLLWFNAHMTMAEVSGAFKVARSDLWRSFALCVEKSDVGGCRARETF